MPRRRVVEQRRVAQLGILIRSARDKQGLSQEELARLAGVGTATLRRIERGEGAGPNVFVVLRIFEELDIHVKELMTVRI
ncbi:transcriptional regulator with XRE-family HTH domain [Curtobacterium flaccumfaciens]|nr:helix-turn-helix transcriptional regulator [Curtobacterium flaccumfaciens]MDQ0538362.1 transcriptional regulator with XRE-family HTH domain [Curtobacterium flaccumfaciens]